MSPTVRALPTPHDPAAGDVTVATPSCCCCCCCCLASLGAATGYLAGATYETAVRHSRPRALATLLAAAALPLAIVTLVVLLNVGPGSAALARAGAVAVYVWLSVVAFHMAGATKGHAVGVPLAVAAVTAILFVVELPLALLTAFVVELAAPFTVWLGVWLGRSNHRSPTPPWPQPPSWPVTPSFRPPAPPPPPPPSSGQPRTPPPPPPPSFEQPPTLPPLPSPPSAPEDGQP